jgi:tetracycline resistance efflux pump
MIFVNTLKNGGLIMDLFLALLPALVMIALVIITRKVLLSLSIGILLASLLYTNFNVVESVVYIWESFWGIISDFEWYMPILGFVVIIGGITSVITLQGGVRAFAEWAISKVKNPKAAQLVTWVLGLVICIDDYFNALVIGEVSKPITDRYKVSRAKLAYIIDSTSAPVVILMPISTWGAFIVGTLGQSFNDIGYVGHTGFTGFLSAIVYQLYPIAAIITVFLVIKYNLNIGPMKNFEQKADEGDDISKLSAVKEVSTVAIEGKKATQWNLIVPILVLVFVTFFRMFIDAGFIFRDILTVDITIPLFNGGVAGFLTAVIFALLDRNVKPKSIAIVSLKGFFAMFKSAAAILILAWMVSGAIQSLEAGEKLADVIAASNLNATTLLPFILFLIAGGIAFATGTSWGTFAIVIPIAAAIANRIDITMIIPMIAAVLGGAVFGDHSSPVSDTTVLSATGAQSTLHAHFISQLPYALITAGIAALGYLFFGILHIFLPNWLSLIFSYGLVGVGIFLFVFIYKKTQDK